MKLLHVVVCLLALGSANAAFSASVLDGTRAYNAVKYALALEIFEDLGLDGNARAQAWAGYLHERGEGTNKDLLQAAQWYAEGAERNHPVALYRLGYFYESGRRVTRDYKATHSWYQRAAGSGNANAQYGLARPCRDGISVTAAFATGRAWYLKAATTGLRRSSRAYYDPDPGASTSRELLAFLERNAAERGISTAVRLGYAYRDGSSAVKAVLQWFLQAALQDHAQVQTSLAYMYQHGEGGSIDLYEALFSYEKAAALEDPMAQTNLGWMLNEGIGVPRNTQRAMRLFRLAAEQGYAHAENNIGYVLLRNGNASKLSEAIRWFKQAAEQDIAAIPPPPNIGYVYQHGIEVSKNLDRAFGAYQRAAAQQHVPAMEALGYLLQSDAMPMPDAQESRIWFERAAAQGSVYIQQIWGIYT